MDSQKIKILLEKYYQGETSLEEENILKEYFGQENAPKDNTADMHIINYFEANKTNVPDGFDQEINEMFEKKWKDESRPRVLKFIKWSGSIAAALIIAIGIAIYSNRDKSVLLTDTYTNPSDAYEETKQVLLFISNSMNKNTSHLKYLSNVDNSLQKCSKLTKIDETLNSIKK